LATAGYRTIYLTAARTAHYGLVDILKQSGFTHIIDGQSLAAADPNRGNAVVDSWIESVGLPELETALHDHDGPFFLHIHAHNAHVPHHVEKPIAFARHDHIDDRGRFLNALEETDDLFSRLVHFIQTNAQRRNPDDAPILIISSDHGQSFGEHHYRSHASATTAEQIQVPLTIHHPLLPAISAPFSSHFDVFPTVLDLVGLPLNSSYGQSLLNLPRPVMHFLFDGEPARPTSTCLGLVIGEQKYSLDLLRDTLVQSNWDDENRRMLQGEERDYFEALIGVIAKRRGLA
jgi:phosphoglycerol transferase MdoB-like AlkP superfamily enzyme